MECSVNNSFIIFVIMWIFVKQNPYALIGEALCTITCCYWRFFEIWVICHFLNVHMITLSLYKKIWIIIHYSNEAIEEKNTIRCEYHLFYFVKCTWSNVIRCSQVVSGWLAIQTLGKLNMHGVHCIQLLPEHSK